jgi:integrase
MLELLHRGGLRVSEVCKLRRRDVVWEPTLLRPGEEPFIGVEVRGGKGGKDRSVRLDPTTMEWLRNWDGRRPRGSGEAFFLCIKGEKGRPVSSRYVEQLVKLLARKAAALGQIDEDRAALMTPHKFRHAHASELLEENRTIEEIRDHLGHKKASTTEVYLHVRPQALAQFMANRAPDLPGPSTMDSGRGKGNHRG